MASRALPRIECSGACSYGAQLLRIGIGFHTPANVHYGHSVGVAKERSATLAASRRNHSGRFNTTNDPNIVAHPEPCGSVSRLTPVGTFQLGKFRPGPRHR